VHTDAESTARLGQQAGKHEQKEQTTTNKKNKKTTNKKNKKHEQKEQTTRTNRTKRWLEELTADGCGFKGRFGSW